MTGGITRTRKQETDDATRLYTNAMIERTVLVAGGFALTGYLREIFPWWAVPVLAWYAAITIVHLMKLRKLHRVRRYLAGALIRHNRH